MDVNKELSALIEYAAAHAMIDAGDKTWAYNAVLEAVGATGPAPAFAAWADDAFNLADTLEHLVNAGVAHGVAADTVDGRQMLSNRIMGLLMPRPSQIADTFNRLRKTDAQAATTYFYQLCGDADYIKRTAIERDVKWTAPSAWGRWKSPSTFPNLRKTRLRLHIKRTRSTPSTLCTQPASCAWKTRDTAVVPRRCRAVRTLTPEPAHRAD